MKMRRRRHERRSGQFLQHRYLGSHIDIAFVYAICRTLGLNDTQIENGLISYEPLPHRLRLVGEKNSIRFYDDSISTICDTTIQALKSVSSVGSVLIGGMGLFLGLRRQTSVGSSAELP